MTNMTQTEPIVLISAPVSTIDFCLCSFLHSGSLCVSMSHSSPQARKYRVDFSFLLQLPRQITHQVFWLWNYSQFVLYLGEIGGKYSTHQRLFLFQQRNYGSLPKHSQKWHGGFTGAECSQDTRKICFLYKYVYCSWHVFVPLLKKWLLIQPLNHWNCGLVW